MPREKFVMTNINAYMCTLKVTSGNATYSDSLKEIVGKYQIGCLTKVVLQKNDITFDYSLFYNIAGVLRLEVAVICTCMLLPHSAEVDRSKRPPFRPRDFRKKRSLSSFQNRNGRRKKGRYI